MKHHIQELIAMLSDFVFSTKLYSVFRKPCDSIIGYDVNGLTRCENPARLRWIDTASRKLRPICSFCFHFDPEVDDEGRYDVEIGINESLYANDPGYRYRWTEVELSDCRYGCKIYQNDQNGRRVLAHNSSYGCRVDI